MHQKLCPAMLSEPDSRVASVRPGICEQWPGHAIRQAPCQCAQDQELDRPIQESDSVRRKQFKPDGAAEPGKIAGSQEHFARSDPQHVAARPTGLVHPHEEKSVPVAVSEADEAG